MMIFVVMVIMVMGIAEGTALSSSSYNTQSELQRLRERIDSHTETLRNINWYLKQTDVFWVWFQANQGNLDKILSLDHTSPPSSDSNEELLQRLEALEDALKAEKQKTNRLESRLQELEKNEIDRREEANAEGKGEIKANDTYKLITYVRNTAEVLTNNVDDLHDNKIPALTERMTQLEARLGMVNQTARENQMDVGGVVTDVREIQQQIEVINKNHDDLGTQNNSVPSKSLSKKGRNKGLQRQITSLQNSVAVIQGSISQLDGRISGFKDPQHDQIQHSQFSDKISQLQTSSNAMNQEIETTILRVDELEDDVADLKELVKLTNPNRIISSLTGVSSVTPSWQPVGPPSTPFDGRFGWPGNQGWRGTPGDPGTPGTPGTPGAPGSRGERGNRGTPGGRGWPGSPGPRGEQGSPGSRGMPGEQGMPGSLGTPGSRGAPGSAGSRGVPGNRGAPGSAGSRGVPGSRGAPGSAGSRGVPGSRGAPGSAGSRGVPGSRGAPGSVGSRGVPGSRGAPGTSGYSGP